MTAQPTDIEIGDLVIVSAPVQAPIGEQASETIPQELVITGARKEIVFIEDDVPDIDTLIQGIGSSKEIIILDSARDGLDQIAQALTGRSGIDALHIMSHGHAGAASSAR